MHHAHYMARYYEGRFSGKLSQAHANLNSWPKIREGIWCLKLNDELLVRGTSHWKYEGNLERVVTRLMQGDVRGDSHGRWVEEFFDHHIRPVIEAGPNPIHFHPADIPKACAEFWEINCVYSHEKIDTRQDKWWKSLQPDGPFEDLRELEDTELYRHILEYEKDYSEED